LIRDKFVYNKPKNIQGNIIMRRKEEKI